MPEIANVEQAKGWDGPDGEHWTHGEDQYNASMVDFYRGLVAAAGVQPDDWVLDIGCGTGQSTRDAARAASNGFALGADLSASMLQRARQRATEEGLTNVEFVQADAQVHEFPQGRFDLVISRFGVMFFNDPVAAFSNIRRALKPEGRARFLVWRGIAENEFFATVRNTLGLGRDLPSPPPDAPGPMALADPERVRALFGAAGFMDVELTPVDGFSRLGASVEDAQIFMCGTSAARGLLADLDDTDRERARAALRDNLEAHLGPDGIRYPGGAWVISARAS